MVGTKILVLGGTGPTGICLLRELVFRNLETVVYARNPSKIPEDLASSPLLEIIKGEMHDRTTLSPAIASSRVIISLLGPNTIDRSMSPTLFADMYKDSVFPLMREHGVRRIFAMGTISIVRLEDRWSLVRSAIVMLVRTVAYSAYANVVNIGDAFENHASGLDWTVYRIARIPGGDDERSWRRDREDGEVFVGWVWEKGWTISQRRGALARWLVDAAEGGAEEWRVRMPTGHQRLAVVIPKMEQSPSMKPHTLTSSPLKTMKDSHPATRQPPGSEDQNPLEPEPVIDPEILESEMELVSSLAKLQKLEDMIHQLRTLLPERLLEPLAPIVNPKAAATRDTPDSPQKLLEMLSQAARGGVKEVGEFQGLWRGREMKPVWERVDTLIYENAGRLLQPNGVWERDYDELLEELTAQDSARKEQQRRANEEQEREQTRVREGGWKGIVEEFAQRDVSGVKVASVKDGGSFFVVLSKMGLAFKVIMGSALNQSQDLPDWNVSSKSALGEPTSRLEKGVLDCLNSRPRKWDLAFLLEMISSYSTIYQTPCTKCGAMQDKSTNLPTIRRANQPQTPTPAQPNQPCFEAYHPTCI
ncbi:mediator complex subunit 27-domain-containing protein [Aspergillus karnatakaensis]|uniref:RNA polymerase II mediator complex subunit MED27 domain-containing protein n=1 Tax=Aspergillus karnatakaensis TaxID=1810916 RepID=UPI003CCCF6D3